MKRLRLSSLADATYIETTAHVRVLTAVSIPGQAPITGIMCGL